MALLLFIRGVSSEILPSPKTCVSETSYQFKMTWEASKKPGAGPELGQLWRFQNPGTSGELVNWRGSTLVHS